MANEYEVGDTVSVTGTFKDQLGVLTDPTVVKLDVSYPGGTVTTYTYGGGDRKSVV